MPIYLIETDANYEPLDPVGGWYGPIAPEISVDWIGYETDCNDEFKIVPEIEFPTQRHYRRDDWLCVGVRPTRAMPRGLRVYLRGENAGGTEPPGIIGTGIPCWDPDPANADHRVADYSDGPDSIPSCYWRITTNTDVHSTSSDPLDYGDDDYVLASRARYVDGDGAFWQLCDGPTGYDGQNPLETLPFPTLAIARRRLGAPVNKERSVVLETRHPIFCAGGIPDIPWEEDFDNPRFGLTPNRGWYPVTEPEALEYFRDSGCYPPEFPGIQHDVYASEFWRAFELEVDVEAPEEDYSIDFRWTFDNSPPFVPFWSVAAVPLGWLVGTGATTPQSGPTTGQINIRNEVRVGDDDLAQWRLWINGVEYGTPFVQRRAQFYPNCLPWTVRLNGTGSQRFDNLRWRFTA